MKAKHTPAPWDALHANGFIAFKQELSNRYRCIVGKKTTDMSGKMTAMVFGDTKEEAEANARLVSSCPDLIEALQDLLAAPSTLKQGFWYDKAKSAIEKATNPITELNKEQKP